MRKYIAIILVLIGLESFAQPYVKQFSRFEYVNGQQFDSAFRVFNLKPFTGDTVVGFNPYTKKIGYKIVSSIDTTSLSNRINLKLNISDTAAMLNPYALTSEVPTYLAGNGIIKGGNTFYRDSLKSTGQYGNSWQNGMFLGSSNNRSINLRTNNLQRATLDSNGRFGVNTNLPIFKFHFNQGDYTAIGGGSITSYASAINRSAFFGGTLSGTNYGVLIGQNSSGYGYINGVSNSGGGDFLIQPFGSSGNVLVGGTTNAVCKLLVSGGVTIGTTNVTKGYLMIDQPPTATANSANINLGTAATAFNGSTTGKFVGASKGTYFAVNSVGSVAYNYLDFQKNGLTRFQVDSTGKNTFASTITTGGTTGNQTINKPSGTVNIAAAGTTVTVTNSLVSTSSIVVAVVRTNDTTAYIKNVVPSAGSFVITLGAAATSEVSIGFIVYN